MLNFLSPGSAINRPTSNNLRFWDIGSNAKWGYDTN
jgi:hypothetical protein